MARPTIHIAVGAGHAVIARAGDEGVAGAGVVAGVVDHVVARAGQE